ncbi:MAG: ribose-phosphate pyrophosphokinase [Chloroflexi bacterium]|nr:ribose-phosphate pyrophosphokinase [Chloroflexota bacterium]
MQSNGYANLIILAGNSHRAMSAEICAYLEIPEARAEVFKFRNDNTFVRILENVRQRDVYILQTLSTPVNDHIMELLIMIDAAKRSSAGRITAVIPYYAYGRSDKKDQPRVPITARLLADLLTTAGANRVLTVDLHAGQIQGFFNIPVDVLTAEKLIVNYFKAKALKDLVVVAPDIGISKTARNVAEQLDAPLAIVEKRRAGNDDKVESLNVIGNVAGHPVLTIDDEIDTGGTLLSAIQAVSKAGATEVYSSATHGVFSDGAVDRLLSVETLKELVVTDSVPSNGVTDDPRLVHLQLAPLMGEAIRRIHDGESVGSLFR